MTNEEAKQEAIKKSWTDEVGLDEYERLSKYIMDSGFIDFDYSDEGKILCSQYNNLSKKGLIFNDQFRFIPFSLCGMHNNNGWIRIEPDGSNLPADFTKNYKTGKFNQDGKFDIDSKDYGVIFVEKRFQSKLITHYKPIKEELKPIY